MKRPETLLTVLTLLAPAGAARAELWNALDTVPKPNAVLGYDSSVTMRINVDCSNCHRRGMPESQERVTIARHDILDTMPLFRDYFVFGAFEYQGCGSAHIQARSLPRAHDPAGSYLDARTILENARGCDSSERAWPGGTVQACITATPMCSGDPPVAEAILNGGLPGLTLPSVPASTSTVCGNPGRLTPTFDLEAFLASEVAGRTWPRWDPSHITARHVQDDLCNNLEDILTSARVALNRCLVDPDAYWDLRLLDLGVGTWCNPGTIAGAACTSSPLVGTCVCNSASDPACLGGSFIPLSPCNNPYFWKARQQVAVCESHDRATFGGAFFDQPDNRVRGRCRENVAMFFTDGYQGHTTGVRLEAEDARLTYMSSSNQSNMFVFRISDSFRGEADAMMSHVSAGAIPAAFSAVDRAQMRTSFSQVLARIYRGDYAGTAPTLTPGGDRIALSSFVVPGYRTGAPVGDRYIGWPNRIALHAIDAAGNIAPTPLFQTDWSAVVSRPNACRHERGGATALDAFDRDHLGPGGTFDNGTSRDVFVPAGSLGDRDGDGDADPEQALRWGRFFGFGSTRPVIVEAPNEAPDGAWALEWASHVGVTRTRRRMIYSMGGGYVLGFDGGPSLGEGYVGSTRVSQRYDETSPDAGTEVLRYRPSWLRPNAQHPRTTDYDMTTNPLVPQRMTTGELIAREMYVRIAGVDGFRTLLVGAEGKEGAGYFTLDITNPCDTRVLAEWLLPDGARASAKPGLYYLPQATHPVRRAAVVTSGGLDGLPLILAYDARDGVELGRRALPAPPGTSYPTAPICVDVTGEGVVTHCYLVRSDGYLARVRVDPAGLGFSDDDDLTPIGPDSPIGGARTFSTEPAVFFGTDGAVNLVYGSGSHRDLTVPGPDNYVYKVVDAGSLVDGVAGGPGRLDQVCGPSGGSTSGVLPLPPGHRLVSAPVIADGVVAWTSYLTSADGCVSGDAFLYAMRHDTCEDALAAGPRPSAVTIGPGIPTSPVLHRTSGVILARTSAVGGPEQIGRLPADTSGNGRPWARKLYWRYELDVR